MSTTDDRAVAIEVAARLNGWDVTLRFDTPPAKLGAALNRLSSLGYEPRAAAAPGQVKPKRPRATAYDPDGTPICPVHGTSMREGTYGWYCGHKAAPGEPAGPKGYCNATAE